MTNTPPFQTPDAILSGAGSSTQIGPEVLKIGIHRPLVVTDPGVAGSGILDRVVSGLEEAGLTVSTFRDTAADPPVDVVQTAAEAYRESGSDGFIGLDALMVQRQTGVGKRLAGFMLEDPEPLMYHEEPIWRDGEMVGAITSAMYGHTLGRSIGLGYVAHPGGVTPELVKAGAYEIEIAGERYPASVSLAPFHDPGNERIKS